jgi:hypothetical protein
MTDKEKKVVLINITKALTGVSLAVLEAIGAASGNIVFARLTAIPAAALADTDTIGSLLARFRPKHDELLELPAPIWWRSDIACWQGLCVEIEKNW